MKQNWTQRAGEFLAGKGFYIVLLLCVGALGVSGYYLFSAGRGGEDLPVSNQVTVTVTPTPAPVQSAPAVPSAPATPRPVPSAQPVPEVTPKAATPAAPAGAATAAGFTWPVEGQVVRDYTVEALAYDETMGDWRIHDGVDIAAALGTEVMAPAGGTVSDIFADDLMGTTVVILHADGVMSSCANLAPSAAVEIGDTVRTGDIIGTLGATAIAESSQESHLHLSMTRDGVSVDPLEYLP